MIEDKKTNLNCNICYSKKVEKNGEVYHCKKCEHMFKDFSFNPEVEMDFFNGNLRVKKFITDNILFDIEKDSVMTFLGENMLEYTFNPQALLYELFRIASPGMKGEIIFDRSKKDVRNLMTRPQVEMIVKTAGFEVVRPNIFTKLIEKFCKKKKIKFFKK